MKWPMGRDPRLLIKNSSGQALVEYILLLIVILTIVGLVRQFNDSFRNYARNYFEDYLTCLIEAGELPRLGYDGNANTICDDEYIPFTPLNGRPLKESVRLAREHSQQAPSSSRLRAGRSGGEIVGGGSAANENAGGAGSSRVPVGKFDPQFRSGEASSGERSASNSQSTSSGSGGLIYEDTSPIASSISSTDQDLRQSRIPLSEREEQSFTPRKPPVSGIEVDSQGRVKRVPANLEPKKREVASPDTGLSFGDFIKYLLIAIMIILMIIFFGGQAITISKSREK